MIRWWGHSQDLRVASSRIRGELVMRALRKKNYSCGWFDPDENQDCKVLIIGKRYDARTLQCCRDLKNQGVRLVFDLCDNRFVSADHSDASRDEISRLREIIKLADQVVVSTEALAEVVMRESQPVNAPVVIGDLRDDLAVVSHSLTEKAKGWLSVQRAKKTVFNWRSQKITPLVWFGSHGGPYAEGGMSDLDRVRGLLESLSREWPLSLTVISNHEEKFRQLVQPFSIPTTYVKWEPVGFDRIMALHDIALIPVNGNAFTRCKTDNRIVTAVHAGLAVVADAIPSYERYRGVVALDDWEGGLRRYLADPDLRKQHICLARERIAEWTDVQVIADQWIRVLDVAGYQSAQHA